MRTYVLAIILLVLFLLVPMISHADSYDAEGRLKKVYSDFITISYQADNPKSSDMDEIRAGDLAIGIDAQTHYTNVRQVTDLKEGDKIGVNFRRSTAKDMTDKKLASSITQIDLGPAMEPRQKTTTTTVTTVTTTSKSAVPSAP